MNFIDVNASSGHWPFARLARRSFDEYEDHLKKHSIDKALVSNIEALFLPDPDSANRELLQSSRGHSRIVPVPILNLTLPDSIENLEAYRKMADIKAVKLYPNFHNYYIGSKNSKDLANYLSDNGIQLIINARMVDERLQYFALKVLGVTTKRIISFAKSFPDMKFLCTGLYLPEIIEVANQTSNICADMCFADGHNLINELLECISPERLFMGSHTPLMVTEANTLKLELAQIPQSIKEQIASENAKKLFNL